MRKYIIILMFITLFINCHAQVKRYDIDKKMMFESYYSGVYSANVLYVDDAIFNKTFYCNQIGWYKTSAHGLYVNFQYVIYGYLYSTGSTSVSSGQAFYSSSNQMMFNHAINGKRSEYAFVVGNQKLMLVDLKTDEIISILDNSFVADIDFSIIFKYTEIGKKESTFSIYIMNNGKMSTFYNSVPNNTSEVTAVRTNPTNRAKTYSLDGIETKNPTIGVYVQDGEKVLYK